MRGAAPDGIKAFTGPELLATFSAVVAGGKSAQEAVKLIKGNVTPLVQVLCGGTKDGNHQVSFRLTNPTAHGVYLQRVPLSLTCAARQDFAGVDHTSLPGAEAGSGAYSIR